MEYKFVGTDSTESFESVRRPCVLHELVFSFPKNRQFFNSLIFLVLQFVEVSKFSNTFNFCIE